MQKKHINTQNNSPNICKKQIVYIPIVWLVSLVMLWTTKGPGEIWHVVTIEHDALVLLKGRKHNG